MNINIKPLYEGVKIPKYAHANDACFDVCAYITNKARPKIVKDGELKDYDFDPYPYYGDETVAIEPGEALVICTGLSFELPDGWMLRGHVRSSVGIKLGLILANGSSIIDAGYRGEVFVALRNMTNKFVLVKNGDRIAQFELSPVHQADFVVVDKLNDSERGTGGIGSTGKN